MAEGTRLKVLDEHVHALEQQLQELTVENEKKFDNLSSRMEAIRTEGQSHYDALYRESANTTRKLEQIIELLMNAPQSAATKGASSSLSHEERGILPTPPTFHTKEDNHTNFTQSRSGFQFSLPKLEFPTFVGENPRSWVRRCERYFDIYGIKENQKIELVALHLEAKADTWFQGYLAEKEVISWAELAEEVCRRFDVRGLVDVVEEFNKLVQTGTVEEYQEQFEDLRARLLTTKSQFSPEYFLSSFLSGLKDEIKSAVKMLQPRTLAQAFEQAKLQEQTMAAMIRKSKQILRMQGVTNSQGNYKVNGSATSGRGPDTNRNQYKAAVEKATTNRQLIEQRRASSLREPNCKCLQAIMNESRGGRWNSGGQCHKETEPINLQPIVPSSLPFKDEIVGANSKTDENPSNIPQYQQAQIIGRMGTLRYIE
ncbi:uncharacterized protein LOC109716293 [Ananas comosus]|uniref:Uncharacterized protein LOC109716293 n=2 Tax=Ananas comosus TaxID=4615 RepID=A0A6P5FLQ2_ANACO|nr:uncharacterized protein LOC109716293 [Ananas comosus]